MQNYVFVIDANKQPLTPTKPAKARKLLTDGKAAVFRQYPFTIILKKEVKQPSEKHLHLKIDPGSKFTGLAILADARVIWAAEIEHRGQKIKADLDSRRAIRRSRRNRHTRYRQARFLNRVRPKGWLPPSLEHRVKTTMTWVDRIAKFSPVKKVSQELVRFDTQKMQNPEVSGIGYQQGTLKGYEVREYLLEKWGRKCAYCGASEVPLQIEHIHPKAKGGSDRVSNLTLACGPCNTNKNTQDIKDFLSQKPNILSRILKQAKAPLKDAAAVNSTRWKLFNSLKETGLDVLTGTGGQTKFNRCQQDIPKFHWTDAACVGDTPSLAFETMQPLKIKCMGHGSRQMIQNDKYGFPRKNYKPKNPPKDWKTGDIVNVIGGKNVGIKGIRIKTVRAKGSFDIRLPDGSVKSVSRRHIKAVHRHDGYQYSFVQV